MVLSINGLYGSGGNEVAFKVAEVLGYRIFNNEPVEKAAAESGLDMLQATLKFYDEEETNVKNVTSPYSKALLALQMDVLPIAQLERIRATTLLNDGGVESLKQAQTREVLNEAADGDAVFVGKCSSFILEGRKDVLRFFVVASEVSCAKRIAEKYQIDDISRADKLVKRTNARRASSYEEFSGRKWDDPRNYDFCINSDTMEIEKIVDMIAGMVR